MDGIVNLRGCGTALVTPFCDGRVDYDAFRTMLRRQTEAGIDYLLPLGTTGETPCLTDAERIGLLEIAKEESCGRPVVVGGGTNSLSGTIESMKTLEPYGPDAFLIVVPYYNKPTQEGMYRYFKAVAASTDKPVILYNVPGRTGVNMQPQTVLRLAAEVPNIIGIKEASGNLAQAVEIIDAAPCGFHVISGDDDLALDMIKAGGAGVISVASNIVPERMAAMIRAALEGRPDEAEKINATLKELYRVCFVESNPIPAKTMLWKMGLCRNEFRLPMCPACPATVSQAEKCLEALGL